MKQLDKKIITDISMETGIPEAFLEKDWYLVYALGLMQKANTDELQVTFSGGTSLSKGYGIIKRFSEDIDFMVRGAQELKTRKNRSEFKHAILDKINEDDIINIIPESLKSRDENQFCHFRLDYPAIFERPETLRDGIKTEISFKPISLSPIEQEVTTIIGKYIDDAPKVVILCVSPVETAANKFCALMWRINDHYKNFCDTGKNPHVNLVRHMHDLSALLPIIMENNNSFIILVDDIFGKDIQRANYEIPIEFVDLVEQTYNILHNNEIYRENYKSFVNKLYYNVDKDEAISFDDALSDFEKLCNFVIEQKQENRLTM